MKLSLKYILVFVLLFAFKQNHGQDNILVQYFLSTSCPISQKYTYALNQIAKKYERQPVLFELIFLDIKSKQQKQAVSNFIKKYQLISPCKTYTNTTFAKQLGVTVTPEVVVTVDSKIVYQGAIDDWFISWGKNKKVAEQHYLINAIDAVLAQTPIWINKTTPVGCLIELNTKK
jgi:hypothetical protein